MSLYLQDLPWHSGESTIHQTLRVPDQDNPTVPALSPQLSNHIQIAPLISIGTLDKEGRPWTTLWGNGEKGFAQPVAQGVVGIRTAVAGAWDPVVEELVGKQGGGVVREERLVSGLTIDLETRKRVKMCGRMVAGALGKSEEEESVAEVQLVVRIEQSLGNCPKYLNKKRIVAAESKPELISDSPQLPQQALDLIEKADLFFISSSQHDLDMDTNHRGGPPGFVRVISNTASGAVLAYPEYSGNRLYQTLGNLAITPRAGLCIPDFETGNILHLTGTTETLVGKAASALLPRSNLAVKITITAVRFLATALPFRGIPGERSPYNPAPRYLSTEKPTQPQEVLQQATLLTQTTLTPSISRFRFSLENPVAWKPGQYITLDFSSHLDMGYAHMSDDDPQSLNDDFVRTFTVSSTPSDDGDEFEITIRRVGSVTDFMFKHLGKESRERGMHELEVGVRGFGGEFEIQQAERRVCFVAAGVGITPLLPFLAGLEEEEFSRLRVLWSVRKADLAFVGDVVERYPGLKGSLEVFVTDLGDESQELGEKGVTVRVGRMTEEDVRGDEEIEKFYLCTPVAMRKQLEEWLPGKEVVSEDFNF